MSLLQPSRTKFRKFMKGRIGSQTKGGAYVCFGEYGLKAITASRVSSRQIEAARRAITNHTKRVGKLWIRIFPHLGVSKKPADVRMGSGKGGLDYWAFRVAPGRIMFELSGVPVKLAQEAFARASSKLPVKTRIIDVNGEMVSGGNDKSKV